MRSERLDALPTVGLALDLETHALQPGLISPPMVLGSAAELAPDGRIYGRLLTKDDVRRLFAAVLATPNAVLCGANIAFDLLVLVVDFARRGIDIMPQIMAMFDPHGTIVRGECDGRVFEVQLAEGLHAIAQGHLGKHAITGQQIVNRQTGRPGRYSLDAVTEEVQGREDAKVNDRFRLTYADFDDKPLTELPFEAQQYPIDDAVNTFGDALGQVGYLPSVWRHEWDGPVCRNCGYDYTRDGGASYNPRCMLRRRRRNLHALAPQAYFAWAAHIGSAWGLHVPQDEVDKLEAKVDAQREAAVGPFIAAGIIRGEGVKGGKPGSVNESRLKYLTAVAYGANSSCAECSGTGKVPSPVTAGKTKINCKACDGTGLTLPQQCPRTPSGEVGCGRDALAESGDELLMEYAEQPSRKIKTTYIPLLRRGRACNVCGHTGVATKYKKAHAEWCTAQAGEQGYRPVPLIVRVDPLKETLRAAIEDGLHSMPRHGGVRECFVARPGYVYSSEDYKAGELVTLSDACLRLVGWSKLADALNTGLDPHLGLAGEFCNKSYEAMAAAKKAKEAWLDLLRQVAKKSNFGFGGGMAELEFVLKPCRSDHDSFTVCAKGPSVRIVKRSDGTEYEERGYYGTRPCVMMDGADACGKVKLLEYNDRPTGSPVCAACLAAGKRAREMWFAKWAEMRIFFKIVKQQISVEGKPSGTPEIDYPELITRGGLGFCDGANGYFQMALAKAAKAAFCQVQRECVDSTWRVRSSEMMASRFDGGPSPLLGSRAILLFHDEIVAEHPESVASEAAIRVSEVMVEALRFKCPRMYKAIEAEPTLLRRLYKGGEPVWQRGGSKPADASDRLLVWEPKK